MLHANVSSCLKCKTGYFSSEDRTRCLACTAGQYIDVVAQECKNCTYGKYAPQPVSHDCLSCPAGYHTVGVALSAKLCVACTAGTYSPAFRNVNCSDCLAGAYQRRAPRSVNVAQRVLQQRDEGVACQACRAGYHAPVLGTVACSPCLAAVSRLRRARLRALAARRADTRKPSRVRHVRGYVPALGGEHDVFQLHGRSARIEHRQH